MDSSATVPASFCIYGWTGEELHLGYYQMTDLCYWLRDILSSVTQSAHPASDCIVGVGNAVYEFDHGWSWECDGDWLDYKCDEPAKEDMAKLDEIALHLGLPKPKLDSATFYDG